MLKHLSLWLPPGKLLSVTVLMVLLVATVRAETPSKIADIRVLIDISGSMQQTDPRNHRTSAINLLIDSLPEGSQAGVWSFGSMVNLLVAHETVDSQWRDRARERISGLRAIAQRTNIGGVLDNAAFDFGYSSYSAPTDVVLITDGQVDIAPNSQVNQIERDRILSSLIPRYAAAGARIHTLALTDAADTGLLEQMALQTKGVYQRIESAEDIRRFVLRVLTAVNPGNELPLDDAGFDVDAKVSEVTAMILHETGHISLQAPSGQRTAALSPERQRWRVGDGYTLVTIDNPETGRWQIFGAVESGSRIKVVSDLYLEWMVPAESVVIRNRPLNVELRAVDQAGAPVADALTDIMIPSLSINGEALPMLRWQGNLLKAQIPNRFEDGSLDLEVSVDGQTFQRIVRKTVQNRPALTAEVLILDGGYQWRLYPSHRALNIADSELLARIEGPLETRTRQFERHSTGYFYLDLPADAPSGDYRLEASGPLMINGQALNDLGVAPVALTLPVSGGASRIMNLDAAPNPDLTETEPEPELPEQDQAPQFVKEPMPEFEEITAQVAAPETNLPSEVEPETVAEQQEPFPWLTYLLFSLPGVALLVGFFFFYRMLERRGKVGGDDVLATEKSLDDEALADIEDLDFDAGMEPAGADEDYGDAFSLDEGAPVVSDRVLENDTDFDDEAGEPPTPERTEAPRADMEDSLDTSLLDQDDLGDLDITSDDDGDSDEDMFDISNIDESLSDLDDLALDEDDTFGLGEEEEGEGEKR